MEESALDTAIDVGKTVYGGMRRLASRVAKTWTDTGAKLAAERPPEKKLNIPAPVGAGFAGPTAATAGSPKPSTPSGPVLYSKLTGGAEHHAAAGMDKEFRSRLEKLGGAVPDLHIKGPYSGFRTAADQQAMIDKYGPYKPGGQGAAPVGTSQHEKGRAADVGGDIEAAHKNAERFGLDFPMGGEKWHIRKSYPSAPAPTPNPRRVSNEEKEMKNLDEIKAPWANIVKAAADTDRWRKNREEGKRAVSDAKTEKRPGWLKKTVGDYISAKYGVKKEEKLEEIAPAIEVVGWRKQFQDKDKAKAEAKKKAKKAFAAPNPAKGERLPRSGRHPPLMGEEEVKEDKTQTSPGVDTEEHPKKFELPEKYEGEHSVRNIYMEGSGSFYGGAGQGGGLGVAGPGAAPVRRLAPRPQARPQAAAPPAAKPAAAPVTPIASAGPTQTPTPGPTLKAKPDIMASAAPDPRGTPSGEPTKPSRVAGGTPVVAGPATSATTQTAQAAAPAPKPVPVAPTATPAPPAIPEPERAAEAPQVAGMGAGQQRQGPLGGLIKKKIGELGGGGGFKNILGGFLNR